MTAPTWRERREAMQGSIRTWQALTKERGLGSRSVDVDSDLTVLVADDGSWTASASWNASHEEIIHETRRALRRHELSVAELAALLAVLEQKAPSP